MALFPEVVAASDSSGRAAPHLSFTFSFYLLTSANPKKSLWLKWCHLVLPVRSAKSHPVWRCDFRQPDPLFPVKPLFHLPLTVGGRGFDWCEYVLGCGRFNSLPSMSEAGETPWRPILPLTRHAGHSFTRASMSLSIPCHHTRLWHLCLSFTMPRWPSCAIDSTRAWRAPGITVQSSCATHMSLQKESSCGNSLGHPWQM